MTETLRERLGDKVQEIISHAGDVTLVVAPAELHAVCTQLRDDEALRFDTLIDTCGVDYAAYGKAEWETDDVSSSGFSRGREPIEDLEVVGHPKRFAVVHHLLSVELNQRVRVRCYCDDDAFPVVDSVVDIWSTANWFEREAFDLFGIMFEGHPDLRRLLTDYGFVGHPFRKDFPLIGQVEMRYDPEKGRVVYEPVSIEPRVLVPRTIRHDSRYESGKKAAAGESNEASNA
ncbi:MAG: NADH-quinone oxidoreductase subunit C [Gammaproteobacteria bacterium]